MFETIRRPAPAEVTGDGDPARHQVTSLDKLNQLLDHWVRKAGHQQVHSETGQTPRQRWQAAAPADLPAAGPTRPAPAEGRAAWRRIRLPAQGSRLSVIMAPLPLPGRVCTAAWPRAFCNLPVPPVTASWNRLDASIPAASTWPCFKTSVA